MLAPLLWCLASLPVAAPARAGVFDVRALGVLGGDDDSNLSAYAVGTPDRPAQLLLDGGAFTGGLYAWKLGGADKGTPAERAQVLKGLFQSLSAALITHSHLDHVSGLLLASPVLFSAGRKQPLPIVALPQTVEALRQHALKSPLWVDLTAVAKEAPVATLTELPVGKPMRLGDFSVETVLLDHPVPSAAFLLGRGEAFYLHLGDTGPTEQVWKRARPLLTGNLLRAVAVEVSFPTKDEALARQSGHLTPSLLVEELARLTGTNMSRGADVKAVAREVGAALRDCRVVATHIKAAQYDRVVEELQALAAAGLPLVIPQRGAGYTF
jgi:cAMP phosphodiesterase